MKNILDEKKFSRENGERKDIYAVEENGRIPFTFARKKYLETESGIYPTHVCETKMSLENLNEFSEDERVPLFFLPDFPSDGRDSTGMVERKEWKREKVDRKELSSCFEIGIFPLETGEGGKTGHGRSMTEGCRNHPLGYAGSCVGA